MNRPPATLRKTYLTHSSTLESNIESVTANGKNLVMLGVVAHADGSLIATDADGDADVTTPVEAGQFWGLRLKSITTGTAYPLTLLYGPTRE